MTDTTTTPPAPRVKPTTIHACLLQAQDEVARSGIAKSSMAKLGGGSQVAFRGIEAAMNIMSGILIRAGLTVTPAYSDLRMDTRARAEPGKVTHHAMLLGTFTFMASDGTSVSASCYGEAEDTGDKAVTKAQSVSFRTALFQTFVAPTMAIDPEDDSTINGDGNGDDPSPIDGDPAATRERTESRAPAPSPASPRGELPDYPKADFEKNLPAWMAKVSSGETTPQAIITKVSTVGRLNPTQRAKLNSLKRAE